MENSKTLLFTYTVRITFFSDFIAGTTWSAEDLNLASMVTPANIQLSKSSGVLLGGGTSLDNFSSKGTNHKTYTTIRLNNYLKRILNNRIKLDI